MVSPAGKTISHAADWTLAFDLLDFDGGHRGNSLVIGMQQAPDDGNLDGGGLPGVAVMLRDVKVDGVPKIDIGFVDLNSYAADVRGLSFTAQSDFTTLDYGGGVASAGVFRSVRGGMDEAMLVRSNHAGEET